MSNRVPSLAFILVFLSGFVAEAAVAQITLDHTLLSSKIGNREVITDHIADDDGGFPATVPCIASELGKSGASQTWDFTGCAYSTSVATTVDYGSDVLNDVPKGDDPGFSGADFYSRSYETSPTSDASVYLVGTLNSSAFTTLGTVSLVEAAAKSSLALDTTVIVNNPPWLQVPFPVNYLDTWSDTTSIAQGGGTASFARDNVVDGWGTLMTPAGNISALRIAAVQRIWFVPSVGPPVLTSTIYTYEFWSQGTIAASIDHDNGGTASEASYSTEVSSPLPVELVSFAVVRDGDFAVLKWSTASELDNAGFGVERAVGGSDFVEVGFVAGAGTSTAINNYEYRYNVRSSADQRFRLRQIDFDGSFNYSAVVELTDAQPTAFELGEAYPNPFNPSATIAFTLAADTDIQLRVFDTLGREVAMLANGIRTAGRHEVQFDAAGLPSGTYVYRLEAAGIVQTRTVVALK